MAWNDSELFDTLQRTTRPVPNNPNSYANTLWENVQDDIRRAADPIYNYNKEHQEATQYAERNRINDALNGELELRSRAKIDELVAKRIKNPEELLRVLSSDPDLQLAYPTNGARITAIAEIQDRIDKESNAYNALNGYNVTGEGGFFSDLVSGTLKGLGSTAVEPYYSYRREANTLALSKLPLNQLDGIKQKFDTVESLESKIAETKNKLFSSNVAERTRALKDLQYYQGTIDGLALTPEEQKVWDTYGDEYTKLKTEALQIEEDKANLLGTKNISVAEADLLMRQYGRKEIHKQLGIDPSFGEKVWDYMKDSVSSAGAAGKSLGNILSTVIPFLIHPALGAASAGSLWTEYSSKLLQSHLEKYGEIDNTEILKSALYGGLAAAIDFAGSKGFAKGYNGLAGQFFRGLGKTDMERIAAQGAKELQQKWATTLRGLPSDSAAAVAIKDVQTYLTQDAVRLAENEIKDVTKSLQGTLDKAIYKETLGTKAKKAIANLPEGVVRKALETPVKAVEGIGKVVKGVKTGNAYLHKTFDASIGDMAKAGIGLAGENVGSSLVRQSYTGDYDEDELARGIADGFVSGGLFHGASGVAGRGIAKASPVVKQLYRQFTYGGIDLDTKTDFNTYIDKIKNADKDSNFANHFEELTNPYLEQLEAVQERIDKAKAENQGILDTYGKLGLVVNEKGEVTIDEQALGNALANSAVTRKDIKEARNKYLNNKKIIDKAGTEVESRIAEFKAAIKKGSEKILNASKESTEYTEEQKEKIKQNYVNNLNEAEQTEFLQKEEGMSEEEAKAYIKTKKENTPLSEDYTTKVEGTDISIDEVFKRGNTDARRYADVLKDPDVRKAIANVDKQAFDAAIDALAKDNKISQKRADVVKNQLNADKFAQYTRYANKGNTENFNSLNKAIQKDVKDSLGLPKEAISQDKATANNEALEQYVKQQLTNDSPASLNEKAKKIKEDLKLDDAQSKLVDKTVGAVREAITKAIDRNSQLIGKRVYKSEEEAQNALKSTKLEIGYKVNKVSDNEYTLVKKDTKALTDMLKALKDKKEDITKKEVKDFVDEYLKDLDTSETASFNVRDTILKTYEQYSSAPAEDKNSVKEALLGELNKLIQGRKNTLNKVQKIVSSQDRIRSAIHGYSADKDYIGTADSIKKEKSLRKKQEKELREQLDAFSTFSKLKDDQAKALAYRSIHNMFRTFRGVNEDLTNFDTPDAWANINVFTRADLRNLHALLSKILKINEDTSQLQQYIQTMITCIEHTTVQEDTIRSFINSDSVKLGGVNENPNIVDDTYNENTMLRDALHNAFPNEDISRTPLSLPELLLSDSINDAATSYELQEQARLFQQFQYTVNGSWARCLEILNALAEQDVDNNSILSTITKGKIKLPPTLTELGDNPSKLTEVMKIVFTSKESLAFLGLLPTNLNITRGAHKDGKGITSFNDLQRNIDKQFRFAHESAETIAYNDSETLQDRFLALDRVFGGTGAIINMIRTTALDSTFAYRATYKEFMTNLEVELRAGNPPFGYTDETFSNTLERILGRDINGIFGVDTNTTVTEDNLMETVNGILNSTVDINNYEYTHNRIHFIKEVGLYVTARELQRLSTTDSQGNRADRDYANVYKLYQMIKALPDYIPEESAQPKAVTDNCKNDLKQLLSTIAPEAYMFMGAVNRTRNAQRRHECSLDVGFNELKLDSIRQTLYTANGYLNYNAINELSEADQIAVAKILQTVANERISNNPNREEINHQGNNVLRCRTRNIIRDAVAYSPYSGDVEVINDRCILCGENVTANSIRLNNPDYAGSEQVSGVFSEIEELSRHGSRFLDSGRKIDKIFGVSINGNTVYNREILLVLAATGLNNLVQIDKGQSDEYLQSLVGMGLITPLGKHTLLTQNFSDYQSTVESLGRQVIHSLGLRIANEDSLANIESELATELGIRTLQLLESAGYVEKKYVDSQGNLTDTQPEGNSIRAIKISNDGILALNRLNAAENDYTFTDANDVRHSGNVLEELLNGVNEKLPNTEEELGDRQNQIRQQFNQDSLNFPVNTETVDITVLGEDGEEHTETYTVSVIPFTGLSRIEGKFHNRDSETFEQNGENTVIYLPRRATYKTNGDVNSAPMLVELAYKSTEFRTFDREAYDALLGEALSNTNSVEELIEHYPDAAEALGMDLDSLTSYYEIYRKDKNAQIYRRAKEFHRYAETLTNDTRIACPVIVTPNNRFLVDSPIFDYREFKPVRDLFHIVNNSTRVVPLRDADDTINETKQTMAMSTILFNMGVDVDKMTFGEIRKVFERVAKVFSNFRESHTDITREELNKALEFIKYTVYKGKKDTKTFKIDNSLPAQLLIRDLNRNPTILENILWGNPLENFHYLIEVDGLNNGSAHHFSQSGVFSNTDALSIAKAIAVGVIPSSISEETNFDDFISLMANEPDRFRDVYMMSAQVAESYTMEDFIDEVVADVNSSAVKVELLSTLATIFDIKSTDIRERIRGLMSRDVMKKVAMPSTYGAGFNALLSHLSENISKELSKRKFDNTQLHNIYSKLAEFNGGDLILLDSQCRVVNFSQVKDSGELSNYLPFFEGNAKLFDLIRDTCLHNTVLGAKSVTEEATERGNVLSEAVEAQCELFTAMVQRIVKENYADRNLDELTYREQETILKSLNTQFNFGTQGQTLNTLRPALSAALKLISYHNKVTAHYKGGHSSARFGSDLAKESLGSAFSPIYIHGFDASGITECQQLMRNVLGAFTGVHDALVLSLRQFIGEDSPMSMPEAMNRGFIDNFIIAYAPLLDMGTNLQQGLDKLSDVLSAESIQNIRRSMINLTNYAALEIGNVVNLLHEIENGKKITINQFSAGKVTGFTPSAEYARRQLQNIQNRLSANQMKNVNSLTAQGFVDWLETNNKELHKKFANKSKLNTLINIRDLQNALRESGNPFGINPAEIPNIEERINEYVAYKQGLYSNSFFKSFTDAVSENYINDGTYIPEGLSRANSPKSASTAITDVIRMLNLAQTLEVYEGKHLIENSSITKLINQRAYRLNGLPLNNADVYDVLAMLVELSTDDTIPTQDLVRLKQFLNNSAYLNDALDISGFDNTANSVLVDVTEINLGDTLNHISAQGIQAFSTNPKIGVEQAEKDAFTSYVDDYVNRLVERVKDTGATQIIFKMDSAIDYMLLPAVNQRIRQSVDSDAFSKCKIVIVPNISDVSTGGINKNKTYLYTLNRNITKGNLHSFAVINSTENKDLDTLNYKYHGQFTKDSSITGQNFDMSSHGVYFDKSRNRVVKEPSLDMDRANPNIYIANYYGEIQTLSPNGVCTPAMLKTQKNAKDSEGVAAYESEVMSYAYTGLPELSTNDVTTDGIPDVTDITSSIPDLSENSNIVIGINSDGSVMDSTIYNTMVSHIPALKEAHEQAKAAYANMERRFAADPDIVDTSIKYMPISIETHLNDLTPITVTFIVGRDNRININDVAPFLQTTVGNNKHSPRYVLVNDVESTEGKRKLKTLRERLRIPENYASDSKSPLSKWLATVAAKYDTLTDEAKKTTYITIPNNIINKDYTTYDTSNSLRRLNIETVRELSTQANVMYLGSDANPYFYRSSNGNILNILAFNRVKNVDSQRAVSNRIASALATTTYNTIQAARNVWRMHNYSAQKSPEDMNVYETAVYKDLTCKDSQELFNSLVSEDTARNIDTSHLNGVFSKLRSLNMNIRYYMNKLAYSQGGAFIETINAKPTGYINFNTRGTGSHAEVFIHEYTHIPLEYLKYDPNAYRLATQLYQFAAKNLTLEDFECSRDEANRIFNYIFRDSGTTDPQIEFLTYSLTNADFRKALDNMAKRVKFKDEFNSKTESLLARFVNKVSGSLDTSHVSNNLNEMVFDIFKRSIDLCNEYGKKAPRDDKAYLAERMQLSNADIKIQNAITSGLSKVSEALSSIAETSVQRVRTEEALRLAESNQDSKIANQMKDILPAMMDALPSASEGFQDIANQLRQSFEGVSDNNYAYVKLRYQAKETIDKARENSASALNEVIRKATKNISQKTLNEMSEYVLKSDMSCLVSPNGYSKQELGKILSDKKFRRNEIERLEKVLRHNTFGNFYVNASKGLVDKLISGVNTSGIGYNNAYEIANMSGTATASLDSPMESEIDKYITLSVMDKLDSKNPKVYAELYKNLDTLTELLNIHNGLKGMEYSQVYPNSMQKVHIPKGELHGGKITNRYTVVPKSQLKAYKWAGYNSLGKVKFDPFYNSLMSEDFYKVEAKHMPNVPYVDGIPVLTDVFNGRNKSATYLGGKKLETTQISPSFQNQEFQVMSGYLARKVQELNSPNFRPLDPKNIDGVLTPTFGISNKLSGCDFQLNEKDSDKYLNRHVKFTSALGDHYGSIIERMRAPDWNTQVAQALDDLYQQRHTKNDFTWLKENTDNKEQLEVYKLLPYEIKQFFKDKYGVDGVPVETRYLTGIVGYREISASKVDLEWNNKLRKSFTDYVSHIFHNGYVAKGENFLRYLTKLGKENIVIKGIAVSVDNILSNNVTLSVLGLSPEKVCKYQIEGLNNLLKYKEMSRERYMLKTKELTNSLTESDRARIRALEASMHALPISYLAEHGGTPTIAEDVTESDRLAKDFIDTHFKKEFQTIAHNAIGDQKSWVYKHLSDLATFGDITARYAQFKYLTEDKHINQEEAFRQCMQTFIDYSNPLPRSLQYFDSIGALPFTKFLLGNQTNVLNSLVRKPSRALAGIMATSAMGIPSIYDSILGLDSFTKRWKVPGFGLWYDSLGTLPINRAFDIL